MSCSLCNMTQGFPRKNIKFFIWNPDFDTPVWRRRIVFTRKFCLNSLRGQCVSGLMQYLSLLKITLHLHDWWHLLRNVTFLGHWTGKVVFIYYIICSVNVMDMEKHLMNVTNLWDDFIFNSHFQVKSKPLVIKLTADSYG